jgi:HlyD family secretion protein
MKKFFRTSLWILLALLAAGTFFFLWQNSRPRHDRYESVVPAFDTIERTTVLTGTIEPRDEIQIKPQISGIIAEIAVEPGDQVRIGDIIARIKVVPEASQLSSAQNRLSVASIELNEKETTFRRDSVLYSRQVISRQEFETSLNARARAREEVDAAEDALAIVREGVSRYNATESNTMVRATVDGLVLDVPVQVGSSVIQANTLNDGTTVAVIADMSDLIFRGKVDETEVGMLTTGMPLTITVGAIPELEAHSQIEYIAPKGDNSSGANTFEIKAPRTPRACARATAPTPP